jgi:L-2,4-diaminobutyrate decarboxylase
MVGQIRIREELVHSGAFYLVKTRLRDRTYLRTTIINPRTTENDLSALLMAVRAAASRQPAG